MDFEARAKSAINKLSTSAGMLTGVLSTQREEMDVLKRTRKELQKEVSRLEEELEKVCMCVCMRVRACVYLSV